jgi:glycosyltransferase involved in cell wall biosynthesis
VITHSETSRNAILNVFPFLEDRLSVVYPGIGSQFQPSSTEDIQSVRRRYNLRHPYLLFLGTLDPRKNLGRVLAAWALTAPTLPHAELVVAGMSSELFQETKADLRDPARPPRVRWLGFVPDAQLPPLLSGSAALVYPSLDEGFGFPPLEAMACGSPAIVSTVGSLPEVCGGAAIPVDPLSVESIAAAMTATLERRGDLSSLISAGKQRARRFTWGAAAMQTDAILERVVLDERRHP